MGMHLKVGLPSMFTCLSSEFDVVQMPGGLHTYQRDQLGHVQGPFGGIDFDMQMRDRSRPSACAQDIAMAMGRSQC